MFGVEDEMIAELSQRMKKREEKLVQALSIALELKCHPDDQCCFAGGEAGDPNRKFIACESHAQGWDTLKELGYE